MQWLWKRLYQVGWCFGGISDDFIQTVNAISAMPSRSTSRSQKMEMTLPAVRCSRWTGRHTHSRTLSHGTGRRWQMELNQEIMRTVTMDGCSTRVNTSALWGQWWGCLLPNIFQKDPGDQGPPKTDRLFKMVFSSYKNCRWFFKLLKFDKPWSN